MPRPVVLMRLGGRLRGDHHPQAEPDPPCQGLPVDFGLWSLEGVLSPLSR